MADAITVATCCYCGTHAPLVLTGEGRRELSCQSCGAPIRRLKALPIARAADGAEPSSRPKRRPRPSRPDRPEPPRRRPPRRRRRSPRWMHMLNELVDELEDLID